MPAVEPVTIARFPLRSICMGQFRIRLTRSIPAMRSRNHVEAPSGHARGTLVRRQPLRG
jgi:hypothetical protein